MLLTGDTGSLMCVKSFEVHSTSRTWCALIRDLLLECFLGMVDEVVHLVSLRAIESATTMTSYTAKVDRPSSCWRCLKPGWFGTLGDPFLMVVWIVLKLFHFASAVMSSDFNLFHATAASNKVPKAMVISTMTSCLTSSFHHTMSGHRFTGAL